jgi:hypothetical protein
MSQQRFGNEILIEPTAKAKFSVGITPRANPLATGRVIILGASEGGEPNVVQWFENTNQAKDVLRSGNALRQIGMAFNPSNIGEGAPYVGFIRATTAVQGLYDAGSVTFTALDYGAYTNNIQLKVEAGTQSGTHKVSVQLGDELETYDNLGKAISVQYVGAEADGEIAIASGVATLIAGDADAEVGVAAFDGTLSAYNTIAKMVKAIDDLADWTAELYDYAPAGTAALAPTILNDLASVTCKAAAVDLLAYPNLIAHAINNNSGLISATVDAAGTEITNTTDWVNFASGTAGTMDASAITAALTAIETENCQIVIIDSESAADHAQVATHCKNVDYFRMGVFGAAQQTTAALATTVAVDAAKVLNSGYAAHVPMGVWDFKEDGSGKELLSPKYAAAKIAGLIAGLPVQQPLTRKRFSCLGLQFTLTKTQRESMIRGGVMPFAYEEGFGYYVTHGINTLQSNLNLWDSNAAASPEISLMRASGQFNKEIAVSANSTFIGGTVGVGRPTILGFITDFCKTKEAEGVIAENDSDPDNVLPAWENALASRLDSGDGWSTGVSVRFNNPFNYFLFESIAVI